MKRKTASRNKGWLTPSVRAVSRITYPENKATARCSAHTARGNCSTAPIPGLHRTHCLAAQYPTATYTPPEHSSTVRRPPVRFLALDLLSSTHPGRSETSHPTTSHAQQLQPQACSQASSTGAVQKTSQRQPRVATGSAEHSQRHHHHHQPQHAASFQHGYMGPPPRHPPSGFVKTR